MRQSNKQRANTDKISLLSGANSEMMAPIFSRKKPRQALLAHPNNMNSANQPMTVQPASSWANGPGTLQPQYQHGNTGGFHQTSNAGMYQQNDSTTGLQSGYPQGSSTGGLLSGYQQGGSTGTLQSDCQQQPQGGNRTSQMAQPSTHFTGGGNGRSEYRMACAIQSGSYTGHPAGQGASYNTPTQGPPPQQRALPSATTQRKLFPQGGSQQTPQPSFQSQMHQQSIRLRTTTQTAPYQSQYSATQPTPQYRSHMQHSTSHQVVDQRVPNFTPAQSYGGLPPIDSPNYGQQPWGDQNMPLMQPPGGYDHMNLPPDDQTSTYTPTPISNQQPNNTHSFTRPPGVVHSKTVQEPSSSKPGADQFHIKSKTDAKVEQPSLRYLVATIQGIKHWAQYTNKLPLLFQTIACVNSAVSSNGGDLAKVFMLRDGKDEMPAIYYQTDRQLPGLVRGHWYRCVGNIALGGGKLQVVSIRLATEVEKKLHMIEVKATDKVMRDWVVANKR